MSKKHKSSGKGGDGTPGDIDLDFGGVLRGLGDFVNLVGKLAEAGERHVERRGEFRVKGLGDQARGVYGFSIRSGIGGGKPRVEPFGNLHAGDDGLVVKDAREPIIDVFDEGEEIVVTAELPGVSAEEISIRFEGDVLTIETLGKRRYAKDVSLPAPVRTADTSYTYNSGVLEIRAGKRAPGDGDHA